MSETMKMNNSEEVNNILRALTLGFESIYTVNLSNGNYTEYSSKGNYDTLKTERSGTNFFEDTIRDISRVVAEEDREEVKKIYDRENILKQTENDNVYTAFYHLLIDGKPVRYFSKSLVFNDGTKKFLVIGVAEAREEKETDPASTSLFANIAGILSNEFESIYYVDKNDNSYVEYTTAGPYESLKMDQPGHDFFEETAANIKLVVFFEDQERVKEALQKETLLKAMADTGKFTMTYRLIIDGKPTHYKLSALESGAADPNHIIIGVTNLEQEVTSELLRKEENERYVSYERIAKSLAKDYFSIYYVDAKTGSFIEYSSQEDYRSMNIETSGIDFFGQSLVNAQRVVYPEDLDEFIAVFSKENILQELDKTGKFMFQYRIVIDDQPTYVSLKAIRMEDDDSHIVFGLSNVDAQKKRQMEFETAQFERLTYAAVAESLAKDYFSIYYVNIETGKFIEYSSSAEYQGLHIEEQGDDFFAKSIVNATRVVYPEDLRNFLITFTKDNIVQGLEQNGKFTMTYRVMVNGEPNHVSLKVSRMENDPKHIVIGVSNIEGQVRRQEQYEKAEHERLTFAGVAQSLAADYFSIYHVNMDTNHYTEYGPGADNAGLEVRNEGEDFFVQTIIDATTRVVPEDLTKFLTIFTKDNIRRTIDEAGKFTMEYQLLVDGVPTHVLLKGTRMAGEENAVVFGVSSIDSQVRAQEEFEKARKENLTFASISQALAADYFSIYYVDTLDDSFMEYSSHSDYDKLNIEKQGQDFFNLSRKNLLRVVYPEDQNKLLSVFTKQNLLRELSLNPTFTFNYRLMFDGVPTYVSMKATRMEDKNDRHIVIGVNNIDAQIRREEEYEKELGTARDIANRDSMTGVKSKHAWGEKEKEVNDSIKAGTSDPFAVIVCDVNGLKHINDTLGHKAGDEYIRSASELICNVFKHSPVFRIGGDEFVVLLTGNDYQNRDALMNEINARVEHNQEIGRVIVATGISDFDANTDSELQNVFQRADDLMYIRKKELKGARTD